MAASIDAVLNLVIGGSSRIDQLINKINQLDGVISAISKTPIDLSVSAAEAEIKRFNNSVLAIGKSLKTAEKSFDDAQKRLDRFQKAFDAANRAVSTSNPNTKKYDQAVERRRKAAEELISALAQLKEAEEAINKIDSSGALENAENRKKEAQEAAKLTKEINALAEQYLKYGEAQKRAAGGQFAGPAPKSIAQLNAQAQALSLVASNTEVATAAFNRFVIASEIAGQETYYAQQEQLKALAAGLSKEASQVSFGGKSIAAARNQVKEFVDSYATLLKSEASMSAFVAQAQKLKSLLPDTVEEFTMLEKVISKASEDIRSIGALGKIKVQIDIDQERLNRLNQLARRRGVPEAYAIQAGPLPEGERGGARYFAERAEIAEELLKIEKEIIAVQKEFADVRSAEDKKAEESAKRRLEIYKNIKKTISNAGDVIFDATTFGKSAEIKKTIGDITRGARNALVRGGLGLGALGAGGLYEGIGNLANVDLGGISWGKLNVDFNVIKGPIGAAAKAISEPINNALQGIPEIIGNFLSALGDIPGALGIAAVAAYALAPAMKTAGEAVYEAGKKFGESDFGQNIKLTLSRQTNIFEEVINAASEMNMTLDASKSGLDAVGQAVRSLPALPAAGETSFRGAIRQVADRKTLLAIEEAKVLNKAYAGGMTTTFMGGGARILKNAESLVDSTGKIAARSQEAADATLFLAERLGAGSAEASSFANQLELGAQEAKRIAEYLEQAKNLRTSATETPTQRFIRENVERGRRLRENQESARIARERSAALLGKSYSLQDVPVRGELLPGGRTETRQPDYRRMLNNQATIRQYVADILEAMSKQAGVAATLEQLEKRTLKNVSEGVAARRSALGVMQREIITQQTINDENERSIQIIRERNRELRRRPIAAMTPQERGVLPTEEGGITLAAGNILDPASLRADRRRRIQSLRERKDARGRALSEGLIGGAFPLLFGQGVGASLGGLAGGVGGGLAGGGLGFGLSLIGTALGTALDQLGAAAAETGKALRDPIAGFEKLKEANLLASRAQEFYIQKLIESGRATQAAAVIQSEIIKKIGVTGVNDLNRLGKASSDLSKAWGEFNLQLQAALAGPMTGLLRWVADALKIFNQAGNIGAEIKDIRDALSPQLREQFDREWNRTATQRYGTTEEAMRAERQVLDRYRPQADINQPQIQLDPQTRENAVRASQQAADEIKQAYRTAFSLQRQAADIERQAADNRRRVEEDIFRKRQEAARLENDNARTAAQIRIESADLAIRKGFAGAEGEARTVLDAVREAIKARATAEADIEQKRRELEINLADLQRESSNYIYEQAMSRMQLERSIEDYKMQVADFQLENQRKIQSLQATEQLGIASGSTLTGISGISQAIERINAAWQFRGTTQQQYKQQGDYQSSLSENFFFDFRPDLIQSAKTRLQSLSQKDIAALAFTVITEAGPTDIGKLDVAANLVTRSAGMGNIPIGQVAKQQNQYAGVAGYTRQQLESPAEGRRLFGREYDRVIRLLGAQNPATQLSPIFDRERTAAQAGNIREGSRVGYAQPTYQYQQAESTVRPISPSLSPNTEGYLQAQSQIEKITRERLQLEKQLSDLGLQGITYGIREAAQGESNILATENQLQLETKRLDLIKSSGLLSQNQLAVESKRLENSAQIQLLKSYETQALEYVNKLATEGVMMNGKLVKITKQEADLYTNEIRTGFEKRIENARIQLNIEAEILQYQQQQAIAERQSAIEREIALSGVGLKFGYIGEAARAFKESLDLGATIQQAQEYADAVQRLQDLPGRKVSEAYDESAVALQRLVDSENQAIFAAQTISDAFSGAFREIIAGTATAQEVLSGFFQNLANSFADMAAQIIAEMIKMYILQQLLNVFGAAAGGAGGAAGAAASGSTGLRKTLEGIASYGYANGGVFANSIKPFAMGGVVNSPTLFKFANGGAMNTGVMGEAGPEAILPLSRGSDGKLGVSASGSGGDVNVTVNVDAKGTSVQGNDQSGNQLGRAISAAVQQEIIKQRRPGGLLNK